MVRAEFGEKSEQDPPGLFGKVVQDAGHDTLKKVDAARAESVIRGYFERDSHGVVAAYLFGSVARGTDRADSDVDVGLLFAEEPEPTLLGQPFDIEADLASELGREVQAVVLNSAPADLVHRVLSGGRLVFEADRAARVRFEVYKQNEYFDMLPVWRRYRGARREGAP